MSYNIRKDRIPGGYGRMISEFFINEKFLEDKKITFNVGKKMG